MYGWSPYTTTSAPGLIFLMKFVAAWRANGWGRFRSGRTNSWPLMTFDTTLWNVRLRLAKYAALPFGLSPSVPLSRMRHVPSNSSKENRKGTTRGHAPGPWPGTSRRGAAAQFAIIAAMETKDTKEGAELVNCYGRGYWRRYGVSCLV